MANEACPTAASHESPGRQVDANAARMRSIAERLIASVATDRSATSGSLSFSLSELRPNLLVFMGRGGARALVARALFLASRNFPALRGVTASEDGTFVELDEAAVSLDDPDFREARVSLLTEMLLLLLQFLGSGITLAVVRDAWPQADLDDLTSAERDIHEKDS